MANYTPFVKPNYIAKDGTRRTLIATGYSIKPEHWDEKKKWVKRACPKFEEIDATLTKIISKIGNILTFAKDNDIDPVIEFLLLELEKNRNYEQRSNRVDIFETLEVYIEEKTPKVSATKSRTTNRSAST